MSFIQKETPMWDALQHAIADDPREAVGAFFNAGDGSADFYQPLVNQLKGDSANHRFEIDINELLVKFLEFCVSHGAEIPKFQIFDSEAIADRINSKASGSEILLVLCQSAQMVMVEKGALIKSLFHSHPSGVVLPSRADFESIGAMRWLAVDRGWVLAKRSPDWRDVTLTIHDHVGLIKRWSTVLTAID